MEELEKGRKEIEELAKEVGRLDERNRIMTEILKTDLPARLWSMIAKIINPD